MTDQILFNSSNISKMFEISIETVRTWSEEFAGYLSPTANPGHKRTKLFTLDDLTVLALVAELKKLGQNFQDVHVALQAGQRGNLPYEDVEALESAVVAYEERELKLQLHHTQLAMQRLKENYEERLQRLQADYDEVMTRLGKSQQIREDNIRLQVRLETLQEHITDLKSQIEKSSDASDQRLTDAQKRIQELERQVGEAYSKGVLDALRKRGELPD